MPDDFTPEEKKMLAESPADSATFIEGDDEQEQEAQTGVPEDDAG